MSLCCAQWISSILKKNTDAFAQELYYIIAPLRSDSGIKQISVSLTNNARKQTG